MHIHHQRMLGQPRDALQFTAMLEPLERLLNAPALMVKLAKRSRREFALRQIGRHHPNEPIRGDALDQSDLWRSPRAPVVFAVPLVGLIERDHGIHLIAALKSTHRRPATAGLLATHTKPDIV